MEEAVDGRMVVGGVCGGGGVAALRGFGGFVLVGDVVSAGPSASMYVLCVVNCNRMPNVKRGEEEVTRNMCV